MIVFDYSSWQQSPVKDVVLKDLQLDEELLP